MVMVVELLVPIIREARFNAATGHLTTRHTVADIVMFTCANAELRLLRSTEIEQ
jgi:hypothetical protein